MAGGFRITESGDFRIAENSDARVTENFFDGSVSLSAQATITPLANFSVKASASLTSDGSVMLAGVATAFGRSDLSAQSNLSTQAEVQFLVYASLDAAGVATAAPKRTRAGGFAAQSDGSVAFNGLRIRYGSFDEQASGSIDPAAQKIISGDFESFVEDPIRITESGDIRITEGGDQRQALNVPFNSGLALLVANAGVTVFNLDLSAKYSGDWKGAVAYVNVNGEWVEPEKGYMKISGAWKRIA